MKKKLLAVMLAATCCLSLAGCNIVEAGMKAAMDEAGIEVEKEESSEESSETVEESTPESTEESSEASVEVSAEPSTEAPVTEPTAASAESNSVQMPTELSDDVYDFQVSIEGTVYQFPMWYSDFEAMGWKYDGDSTQTLTANQYTVAETWVKDGVKVYAQIANLSMNEQPFSKCMIAGITLDNYYLKNCDWEIKLPGGIQYGVSTKEDVLAAYGTPSYEYEGSMYYKAEYEYDYYQNVNLYIFNETGTLDKIEIENMIELEGADNSVDPTVPDIVKQYEAPTSVGNDLYAYDVQLEGAYYTLPCPVSELLANGFKIKDSGTDKEVAADSYGWVELVYDNQSFRAIARNYANYATIVENCFITSMESSEYGPDYDLVIPCDIKRGMSEADLVKKLEGFNYDKDESSNYVYYSVYNPDDSKLNGYDIVVKEGAVYKIEVSNSNKPNK